MTRLIRTALPFVAIALTSTIALAVGAAGTYDLVTSGFGSGGVATGGPYAVSGTAGNPTGGAPATGGAYEATGGSGLVPPIVEETPPCPADLDGNGAVGFADLSALLGQWGACPGCAADVDGNGVIGFADLNLVLTAWGPCP